MREENVSGAQHFIAQAIKVGRSSVKILKLDNNQVNIAIPDGIQDGLKLPPTGTILQNVAVSTNGSLTTLYGFYPAKGDHVARFDSFVAKKGALPTPSMVEAKPPTPSRPWEIKAHRIFTALVVIDDPEDPFNGCLIPWTMDYIFDQDFDGSAKLTGTVKQRAKIRTFLELCGFDVVNEIIDYSENMLPGLEQLLSERSIDHSFRITMKTNYDTGKCWLDTAEELPAGFGQGGEEDPFEDDLDEDEEEDLVPPKKTRGEAVREIDPDEEIEILMGKGKSVNRASRVSAPSVDDEFEDGEEDEPPARKPARKGTTGF